MELTRLLLMLLMALSEALDGSHFVLEKRPTKCLLQKTYGMQAAACHGLNLRTVPANLKNSIEVLDASYNRIRELTKTTFSNYGYLKMLYLEDNLITYIEEGAFAPLAYLEVVDLSSNGLDAVPRELVALPSLRKIYMNNNRLTAGAGLLGAPSSQTLEFLSLAECHLDQFPTLDGFHFLKTVNLSGNELRTLSTQQLAPLCLLETLDLRENPLHFQAACDCFVVQNWVSSRGIRMPSNSSFSCKSQEETCVNSSYPEESIELYESCMEVMKTKQMIVERRTTWIIVAVMLACSLFIVFLVLFWVHRRNKRKSDSTDESAGEKMMCSELDS